MEKLVLENYNKIVVSLFGAAFVRSLSTVLIPTENRRIQVLSRPLCDFPVLFKAYLIFKDFSRKPYKAKKKNILDSQAPPHCPQSPRITDFFKPKKRRKEKFRIKKICYFVSSNI